MNEDFCFYSKEMEHVYVFDRPGERGVSSQLQETGGLIDGQRPLRRWLGVDSEGQVGDEVVLAVSSALKRCILQ